MNYSGLNIYSYNCLTECTWGFLGYVYFRCLTSLPVNRQGDKTGTASPSYWKESPLKWDLAMPTSSSWLIPVDGAYVRNTKTRATAVVKQETESCGPTSCSRQHHPGGFVMAADEIHQVLTGQIPDSVQHKKQRSLWQPCCFCRQCF